jgi:hypothetical protein
MEIHRGRAERRQALEAVDGILVPGVVSVIAASKARC